MGTSWGPSDKDKVTVKKLIGLQRVNLERFYCSDDAHTILDTLLVPFPSEGTVLYKQTLTLLQSLGLFKDIQTLTYMGDNLECGYLDAKREAKAGQSCNST